MVLALLSPLPPPSPNLAVIPQPLSLRRVRAVIVIGLCLLRWATGVAGAEPTVAEKEYLALKAFREAGPPQGTARRSQDESAWMVAKGLELHARGLKFGADHPNEPLRWEVWTMLTVTPQWERTVVENGVAQVVRDRERMAAWSRLQQERLEQLLEAPDASPRARTAAFSFLITNNGVRWKSRVKSPEGQAVLRQMLGWFERWERELPQSLNLINGARSIAEMLDAADPAHAQRFLLGLIQRYPGNARRDVDLRTMAEGRLKLLLGQAQPVWLRLAALDGRFADTQDFVGKLVLVVIIPLTWKEQVDFLHGLHTAYQKQGLEIIQVTGGDPGRAGDAPLTALDTALDVDAQQLPWRVAWDRKGTIGEVSRSLGKNVYPAWLLIARDGRFVAETSSQTALLRALERELALKPE